MFYPARGEPTGADTVVGAGVAVTSFLKMLDRHASARLRASAYVVRDSVEVVEARLRAAAGRRKLRVEVRPLDTLAGASGRTLPSVWHDINSDVRRPFALRHAAASRAFPISITHHTVSYTFFVHDWYLPLLLGDVRPYDTVVCTSVAARTAIRNVLDLLAEQLARTFGMRVRYRGRLDVVPLGVDTEQFRPRPQAPLRRKLGLPTDRKIVLWVGRFSASDKADLLPLIRVFADIARRARGLAPLLVLAGTDRRHDAAYFADYAVRLGIADALRIVRGLDPAVRHDWFAAADVFVSPVDNIQETFGLTPIEAMACGVPAVVSDWDGYKDTVIDGETGFRITTRWARCDADINAIAPVVFDERIDQLALGQSVVVDIDQLGARLALLLEDGALRRRLGEAARARAIAVYGWDQVVAAYEALWREQLAHTQAARFRPRAAGQWSLMPAFDAFGHYATETLPAAAAVVVTELGLDVLAGREPLPTYHTDEHVLRADLLEDALATLADRGARGLTLGGLAAGIARRHGVTRDAGLRHVLWLLKYGHARVAAR
jgi:D-inositol-3-phosphate glycosyltransferase